jgi:hypothetical protein
MPRYVIERKLPQPGSMSEEQIRSFSQKVTEVLGELGPQIQWLESYVTENKMYCVYIAPNADVIIQHAEKSGCTAACVSEVKQVIDPTTAEL